MRIFRIGLGGRERRMFDTLIFDLLVFQVYAFVMCMMVLLYHCARSLVSALDYLAQPRRLNPRRVLSRSWLVFFFFVSTPVCVDHEYIGLRDLCEI